MVIRLWGYLPTGKQVFMEGNNNLITNKALTKKTTLFDSNLYLYYGIEKYTARNDQTKYKYWNE